MYPKSEFSFLIGQSDHWDRNEARTGRSWSIKLQVSAMETRTHLPSLS